MPRRHLRLLALLAALITVLVTSCGGGGGSTNAPPLPGGAELLDKSADAMRDVTSVRFGIDVEGVLTIAGVQIKSATGQLTNEGSAKGNATADMGRQLFELTFVIIGKDLYLRGPTGGFSKMSANSLSAFTELLNPDRGMAGVLASGAAAETEGREQVGGVDSYRVKANFSGQSLSKLLPGPSEDVTGQVWIAVDDSRVVQAVFPIDDGNVTFRFSDFNAPADITAPN